MDFLVVRVFGGFDDLIWGLYELQFNVTIYDCAPVDPVKHNAEIIEPLADYLSNVQFDGIFSALFIPEVALVCQDYRIPYISWVYDSPSVSLFHQAIYSPYNHVFIFDRSEYNTIKALHVPHVYHLPLGVNTTKFGALEISSSDETNYSHDVSFVGQLYMNNMYNMAIHALPEKYQLELKSYLLSHLCTWNCAKSWPVLSEELTSFLINNYNATNANTYELPGNLFLGNLFLSRKLAEMDRITVLNTLSEHFTVDLYSTDQSPLLNTNNIVLHEPIDYDSIMPKVFYLSKINLNITLPSIETGVPLRVFDIMGCGGFVLTNYQDELNDLFVIGHDIEVFHDLPELIEKTSYYLTHEEERLRIAMNGYQKVRKFYTTKHRVNSIVETVYGTEVLK